MNTWSLSFLLLLVVACGLLFQMRERFEDLAEDSELMFDTEQVELRHSPSRHKPKRMPLTYSHDINIARELNTRPALAEGFCNCAGRVEGFADAVGLSKRKGSAGFADAVGLSKRKGSAVPEGFANEPRHKCPVCPDMSKYIRLDEVPCWNCSLP
jgi:hypothetical protein